MKYKVLPNARLVITTDGSNQLLVDTGSKLIPLAASLGDSATQSVIDALAENGQIGHEKIEKFVILPETTAEIVFNEDLGTYAAVLLIENEPNFDATLTVVLDGVKYTCPYSTDAGSFGNFALVGEGEDTGEPFLGGFSEDADNNAQLFIVMLAPGVHTISIETERKVLLPMDARWMPTIPIMKNVIQLDTYTEGHTLLTDECAAEFDQFVSTGTPFFIGNVRIGSADFTAMFSLCVPAIGSNVHYVSTLCWGVENSIRVNFFFTMHNPQNGISLIRV